MIIFKCPIIIPRYFLSALPLSNGLWYMGALVHRLSAEFIVVLHSFHQIYPFLFKFSNAFFFQTKFQPVPLEVSSKGHQLIMRTRTSVNNSIL